MKIFMIVNIVENKITVFWGGLVMWREWRAIILEVGRSRKCYTGYGKSTGMKVHKYIDCDHDKYECTPCVSECDMLLWYEPSALVDEVVNDIEGSSFLNQQLKD